MADKSSSVSIVYEESESRPTVPVMGAYGGPCPDGSMVVAHVYSEFGTIPAMEDHEVSEAGSVDLSKGHAIKRGDVTRKVLATLVISPEAAITVGKWLVQQGENSKKARKINFP